MTLMLLRIFHVYLWIFKKVPKGLNTFLGLGLFLLLVGCAQLDPQPEKNLSTSPPSQVFVGEFDDVWRAVLKAFTKYPIKVNNTDLGILETDQIKGDEVWSPPFLEKKYKNFHYSLRVQVVRGKLKNQNSVRVSVAKKMSLDTDFFSDEKSLNSDGHEEESLLYRVSRELQLEHHLKKAFEHTNE